jgi:hypothetical protein
MISSVGMMKFPIYGKIIQMFETTNQIHVETAVNTRNSDQEQRFFLEGPEGTTSLSWKDPPTTKINSILIYNIYDHIYIV